jgi:hypothetical protein
MPLIPLSLFFPLIAEDVLITGAGLIAAWLPQSAVFAGARYIV